MNAIAEIKMYWLIVEHRETHFPLVADDLYAVFLCALMGGEAPAAATIEAALELEYCVDGVLNLIKVGAVATIAMGTGNDSEDVLEYIYLVRSKIVEVSATRNIGLKAPWQLLTLTVVEVAGRTGEPQLNGENLSYDSIVDNILNTLEVRQITTIVGYKTRHTGLLADAIDANAVLVIGSKGFLHIHRFAGAHSHNGIGDMSHGRSGYIDSVDIRIVDESLTVGIPVWNVMFHRISAGLQLVAAHDGNDM